jgi:hypothetical protein
VTQPPGDGDARLGRVVGGKFRVDAPLGGGGMGAIYRGTHLELGEPVAIKFLRRHLALDGLLRKRFRREAVALARVRHPGIVSILDFGEEDEDLFAVMELVSGKTLQAVLEESQRLPLVRAFPILDQLLAALEICHREGIVHRDLKPSNVMIVDYQGAECVKLIDFGLALTSQTGDEKLTNTGLIQGTPDYMSPEQCRGQEVMAPSDVYSAGVMTYELLTGSTPFHARDSATLMSQHLFVEVPSMRQREPSIPVGVEQVVLRAMAKLARERPSAREMRDALASAVKGTDPHSLAEAAAGERRRLGALTRNERALTGRAHGEAVLPPAGSVRAVVWMSAAERSREILVALGAAGVTASAWTDEQPPTLDEPGVALVVSARHDGIARAAAMRGVPVIVVDVAAPAETRDAIRAGAADFSLSGADDAELGAKIKRTFARRTRRTS